MQTSVHVASNTHIFTYLQVEQGEVVPLVVVWMKRLDQPPPPPPQQQQQQQTHLLLEHLHDTCAARLQTEAERGGPACCGQIKRLYQQQQQPTFIHSIHRRCNGSFAYARLGTKSKRIIL
jgi:hypothetical protein